VKSTALPVSETVYTPIQAPLPGQPYTPPTVHSQNSQRELLNTQREFPNGQILGNSQGDSRLFPARDPNGLSSSIADGTAPVPVDANLKKIAWRGNITRVEAEDLLELKPEGTFLIRWSNNTMSYVLSVMKGGLVQHISGLTPGAQGQISVVKDNGTVTTFTNLESYIDRMHSLGIVTQPLDAVSATNIIYHTAEQL